MSASLDHPQIQERLKRIKLALFDVDGILTDGRIFWIPGSGWTRMYHVRDGFGLQRLVRAGIPVGLISASEGEDLQERVKKLGIPYSSFGSQDKIAGYEGILRQAGVSESEVSYMGDELFDLPVLSRVGLSLTVPEAVPEVLRSVHGVTRAVGGWGAVREVAEAILSSQRHGTG